MFIAWPVSKYKRLALIAIPDRTSSRGWCCCNHRNNVAKIYACQVCSFSGDNSCQHYASKLPSYCYIKQFAKPIKKTAFDAYIKHHKRVCPSRQSSISLPVCEQLAIFALTLQLLLHLFALILKLLLYHSGLNRRKAVGLVVENSKGIGDKYERRLEVVAFYFILSITLELFIMANWRWLILNWKLSRKALRSLIADVTYTSINFFLSTIPIRHLGIIDLRSKQAGLIMEGKSDATQAEVNLNRELLGKCAKVVNYARTLSAFPATYIHLWGKFSSNEKNEKHSLLSCIVLSKTHHVEIFGMLC